MAGPTLESLLDNHMNTMTKTNDRVGSNPIRAVAVLGAGMMGSGIAYCVAAAGIPVILLDRSQALASAGKSYSERLVARALARKKMDHATGEALLSLITTTADYDALQDCDLVIEAVFEDFNIKTDVIHKSEAALGDSAIFATNTSRLRITELAKASIRPGQFIGLHFCSPVDKMPVVEVIPGDETTQATLSIALEFLEEIKKTAIVVNDSWGFYLSRVLETYTERSVMLLADGVDPELIESAGRDAGMPTGPLEIQDEVSINTLRSIAHTEIKVAGEGHEPPLCLAVWDKMVDQLGRPGRKGGGGFYDYPEGEKKHLWKGLQDHFPRRSEQPEIEDLKKCLLYCQSLEAVRCLEEDVIASASDADRCAVVGWNFPAATGGPLALIDQVGVAKFVDECRSLAQRYGKKYEPPALLLEMARNGVTFYPPSS